MRRSAGYRVCACGKRNLVLFPLAACGYETLWDLRCAACGGTASFDARLDPEFRRALAEACANSRDPAEQRAESDRLYAATLPACGCGGSWRVVREWENEPCLGCGRLLGQMPTVDAESVDVPRLRP